MKITNFLGIIISIYILSLTACKNDKDKDPSPTTKTKPSDQAGTSEADEAIDNVNDIINNKIGGGAGHRMGAYNLPCGVVTIDSSATNALGNKVYTVKYGSNTPCGYKYKSGDVKFELINGSKFSDTGAVYKVTFIKYKVEVRATGQIVEVNGSKTITNVSGGYIWYPILSSSVIITHKMRGTLNITFNNEVTRPRNYFQLRKWSSTGGWAGLSLEADGDTIINGRKICETGNTYENNLAYESEIVTPFKWSNCGSTWAGPYVLKTGDVKMHAIIPGVSPAYFQVEAGYKWDTNNLTTTPMKVNDCSSNTYKISIVLGSNTTTQYQLY